MADSEKDLSSLEQLEDVKTQSNPDVVRYVINDNGTVPVINESGEILSLPEDEARDLLATGEVIPADDDQRRQKLVADKMEKEYKESPWTAAGLAFSSATTAGLSDYIGKKVVGEEAYKRVRKGLEVANPTASLVGTVGGYVMPGGAVSLAGKAGAKAAALTAEKFIARGLAKRGADITTAAVKAAAEGSRAAKAARVASVLASEGAAMGVHQAAEDVIIHDKPFSVGTVAESVAINTAFAGLLMGAGAVFRAGKGALVKYGPKVLTEERKLVQLQKSRDALISKKGTLGDDLAVAEGKLAEATASSQKSTADLYTKAAFGEETATSFRQSTDAIKSEAVAKATVDLARKNVDDLTKELKLVNESIEGTAAAVKETTESIFTSVAKERVSRFILGGVAGYGYSGDLSGAAIGAMAMRLTVGSKAMRSVAARAVEHMAGKSFPRTKLLLQELGKPRTSFTKEVSAFKKMVGGTAITIVNSSDYAKIKDDLLRFDLNSYQQAAFNGYTNAGIAEDDAAALALMQKNRLMLLQQAATGNRTSFSKMLNAVQNPGRSILRLLAHKVTEQDLIVLKTLQYPLYRQILDEMARALREEKLDHKTKKYFEKLLGKKDSKLTLKIQESYNKAASGSKSKLNIKPVQTPMQQVNKTLS